MLSINMSDVVNVLNLCKGYLIFIGVVLAVAVIITVVVRKLEMPKRKFVRAQSWVAFFLAVIVAVNLICFGPMNSMISLATGGGSISDETTAEATELCEEIAEEGDRKSVV